RLVELHGGRVEASSAGLGCGSEFVVRLPLARAAAERPARQPPRVERAAPLAKRRILVVDDNHDAADSLGMVLKFLGADIQVAYDGAAALEMLASFPRAIMLLDIGRPLMDGYEVARRARQPPQGQALLLVAMTGWGQDEDRRRTAAAGFDHHLIKPVDPGM